MFFHLKVAPLNKVDLCSLLYYRNLWVLPNVDYNGRENQSVACIKLIYNGNKVQNLVSFADSQ